jgi:hypothetical protein
LLNLLLLFIQPWISRVSRAFYEGVLGLISATTIDIPDGFWVEYEIGPHTLAIGKEPFLKPSGDGAQLVLEVDDLTRRSSTLDATKLHSRMKPFELPVAGRRLFWIQMATNSASTNVRPKCAAAANPAIALGLQSTRHVGQVAEPHLVVRRCYEPNRSNR